MYKVYLGNEQSKMHTTRLIKAISVALGVVFLLSVLTVESHARAQGGLAAKLPTIIDGTIEYAVAINDKVEFNAFRPIEYLPLSLEIFFINKSTTPPQIYRGPPSVNL
jgi:hypothetical protein